ncbi:MAG: tetratricopeptide repeat protein [Pseudomonadota bacterium]
MSMKTLLRMFHPGGLILLALTLQSVVVPHTQAQPLAITIPASGEYSRPIATDSDQAQKFFDQGLRMTWSFYFPEAIASYQEAARHDPDHPMIYYGMAFAMGPNPNSRYANMPDDPRGEGLKAIRKARELSGNGTRQQQDMIDALYVLYDEESIPDDAQRDQAYLDAMAELHQRYPADPDIASQYAAAYMQISRWDYWNEEGEPRPGTVDARAALEAAMEVKPGHPGANHLYIHLMEASPRPELALASAHRLESSVPIAGHMVHMPGHIYLRVGEYEKAIYTNQRSQAVDRQFAEVWGDTQFPNIGTYPLSHRSHAPHALDFVRYAASLQGNYELAIDAAERGLTGLEEDVTSAGRGKKRVVSAWLVDRMFGKWNRLLTMEQSHGGTPYLDGLWSYVTGSAYAASGLLPEAEERLEHLLNMEQAEDADDHGVGPTPASHILHLARHLLSGEIEEARGNLEGAIEQYQVAVSLEDQNNYTEPPDWPMPTRHFLGAALLKAGQPAEAEAVYRRDLEWHQRNGWATFGLQQALEAQGRMEEAEVIQRQFESRWRNATVELDRSRF